MSSWLIIVTGLIYLYIAAEQAYKGNMGMAICYAGYALGNVGLYMMAKQCKMVHRNITYGDTMFTFDEQYKKFEQLNERNKEAYEFWLKAIVSTWEDLFKPKKK